MKQIAKCNLILKAGEYEKPGSRIKAGLAANNSPATAPPKPSETGPLHFTRTRSALALLLSMYGVQTDLVACPSESRLAVDILWQTGVQYCQSVLRPVSSLVGTLTLDAARPALS